MAWSKGKQSYIWEDKFILLFRNVCPLPGSWNQMYADDFMRKATSKCELPCEEEDVSEVCVIYCGKDLCAGTEN